MSTSPSDWPGWGTPHPRVAALLEERPPLAIACSGGADSVALFRFLFDAYGEAAPERLTVLHFDHRVRGDASQADAAFVTELSQRFGIAFRLGERETAGPASETVLREARQAFFRTTLAELGITYLATGHQLEDVVEMMLIRLLRGSGPEGLAAPRPVQTQADGTIYLRPLLERSRAELRANLQTIGQDWREDGSNQDDRILRNALRQRILPGLAELGSERGLRGFLRSRHLLEEAAEAIAAGTESRSIEGDTLGIPVAIPAAALRQRVQRWWMGRTGTPLAAKVIDPLVEALARGKHGEVTIGDQRLIYRDDGLTVEPIASLAEDWTSPPPIAIPVGFPITVAYPNGGYLRVAPVGSDAQNCPIGLSPGPVATIFYPDTTLVLRFWRPGDRYRPMGAPGRRKLQDCFTDRRIPREERRNIPVVCASNGDILWVPGLLPAHAAALKSPSDRAISLTWQPSCLHVDR